MGATEINADGSHTASIGMYELTVPPGSNVPSSPSWSRPEDHRTERPSYPSCPAMGLSRPCRSDD